MFSKYFLCEKFKFYAVNLLIIKRKSLLSMMFVLLVIYSKHLLQPLKLLLSVWMYISFLGNKI